MVFEGLLFGSTETEPSERQDGLSQLTVEMSDAIIDTIFGRATNSPHRGEMINKSHDRLPRVLEGVFHFTFTVELVNVR